VRDALVCGLEHLVDRIVAVSVNLSAAAERLEPLHGRQLLPQLSLLNDRENGAGQANRLSIS
jgi:hypothetical protein